MNSETGGGAMMTSDDVREMLMNGDVRYDVADIVRGAIALGYSEPGYIAALVCDGLSLMIRNEAERREANVTSDSEGRTCGAVPADVHERGWQWRPTSEDTAFAPPFGTIRSCRGCGCLVVGGPTACVQCAEGRPTMTDNACVKQYGPKANGARTARFHVSGDSGEVEVQVLHYSEDMNERVLEVARAMADAAATLERAERAERALLRVEKLLELQEAKTRSMREKLPPAKPARLFGPGFVRFDAAGQLWILSRREDGWASFGVMCDGWDDVFRRYDVRVTSHGADDCGPWWCVENTMGGA